MEGVSTLSLSPTYLAQIITTEGFQVVDNKFGKYPKTGDEVANGEEIALSANSPFQDDDWFTFHSVVCRSDDPTSLSNDGSNDT
jgi:hypothetical protein